MPQSIVLHIKISENCCGRDFHGRTIQTGIAKMLENYARQFNSKTIRNLVEYFNVSPLYLGERSPKPLTVETKKDTLCWFRLSCLEEKYSKQVFNTLYQDVITEQMTELDTNMGPLKLVRAISTPSTKHPWVDSATIDELYYSAGDEESEALFDFVSPTVFVYKNLLTPLPIPSLVYSHLGKMWNLLVPNTPIPQEQIDKIANQVTIVAFKSLSTSVHSIEPGKLRSGFIGKVRFRLIGATEKHLIRHFNLLSNIAFYCCLGRDTHLGCGMVRRIPREKWSLLRDWTE